MSLLGVILLLAFILVGVCVFLLWLRAYVYFGFERSRKRHHWGSQR